MPIQGEHSFAISVTWNPEPQSPLLLLLLLLLYYWDILVASNPLAVKLTSLKKQVKR